MAAISSQKRLWQDSLPTKPGYYAFRDGHGVDPASESHVLVQKFNDKLCATPLSGKFGFADPLPWYDREDREWSLVGIKADALIEDLQQLIKVLENAHISNGFSFTRDVCNRLHYLGEISTLPVHM